METKEEEEKIESNNEENAEEGTNREDNQNEEHDSNGSQRNEMNYDDEPTDVYQQEPQEFDLTVKQVDQQVGEFVDRMKTEMQRTYYITPALFIRFITFYQQLLQMRQSKHKRSKQILEGGIQKLIEANTLVEKMQAQLCKLEPIIAEKAKETEEMLVKIKQDQSEADKMKETVSAEGKNRIQASRRSRETR